MNEPSHGLPQRRPRSSPLGLPVPSISLPARRATSVEALEQDKLELLVRAAACASVSEAEFVRRIRAAGVALWPSSRDATGAVSNYAMELTIGSGRTHRDTDLATDLSLPILRQNWDTSLYANGQAMTEWAGLRRSRDWDRDRLRLSHPSMWSRMFSDAGNFNAFLRTVPTANRSTWAWAAARLAGTLAVWASRPGADHIITTVAATAALELACSAQLETHPPQSPRGPVESRLSRTAYGLAHLRCDNHDPARQSLLLLVQLVGGVVEISKAHRQRGELLHCRRLNEVGHPLSQLCRRLYDQATDTGPGHGSGA